MNWRGTEVPPAGFHGLALAEKNRMNGVMSVIKTPEDSLPDKIGSMLDQYTSAKSRKVYTKFLNDTFSYDQMELSARYAKEVDELVVAILKASSFARGKKLLDSASEEIQALTILRFSDAVYAMERVKFDSVAASALYGLLISGPALRAAENSVRRD